MPKDFDRTRRVAEQIQRELAMLIQQEMTDPRLGMITVSGVTMSRDLKHARVFVTALDETHKHEETIDALQHAAGYLQHELGHRLRLRTIPRIRFCYDESIERGAKLTALIDDAIHSDEKQN